jgi:hypothetical protein
MRVVYIDDPGVLGIVLSEHKYGCMVKYFLDSIEFIVSLEWEEFIFIEE